MKFGSLRIILNKTVWAARGNVHMGHEGDLYVTRKFTPGNLLLVELVLVLEVFLDRVNLAEYRSEKFQIQS